MDCQPINECHLAVELRGNPSALKIMKTTVDAQPTKDENVKRSQVLHDLVRLPNQKLTPKQCRHLGDAIFAYFCPVDATILTTNIKDLGPLAAALGKKAETP
jgi:Fe-S-cluster-containing dehydrogenase component